VRREHGELVLELGKRQVLKLSVLQPDNRHVDSLANRPDGTTRDERNGS